MTPSLKAGKGGGILIGKSGTPIAGGHWSKKRFGLPTFHLPINSSGHLPVPPVSLVTIYSPACQVFNSSTCTHARSRTHTPTGGCTGGPRAWRRGPVQPCELFPGCVVLVKEGDLGFPLKSHQAEHLFKKARGTGGEEWVKRGGRATGQTHGLNIKRPSCAESDRRDTRK